MSKKGEYLRALVTERLTAAAEEIFALFERTVVEYEEELLRSREENQRLRCREETQRRPEEEALLLQPQGELLKQDALLPQTQSSFLDEGSPDSPQTENAVRDALPEFPCVIKTEVIEDSDEDLEEDLEPPTGSSIHQMETEADEEDYSQDYEDDPARRSLFSQFNVERFPSNSASAESGTDTASDAKDKLKKHQCYFCEKKFKDRHSLKRHTVVHTGEKPFQCPVCAKSYSYKETLMAHMSLHGWSKKPGEEPAGPKSTLFTCPICMKTVTTSFALRSHILIHTGEKPYSCPVCNKRFSQKVYVRKHMRTHTGEKPFSCSECDMKFSRKSNLNRHLKVHAQNALKNEGGEHGGGARGRGARGRRKHGRRNMGGKTWAEKASLCEE
uniref:C2H2-type domain-containing protein n=1 Tax=Neogobius melanostomus TaxID=47308 RepID=A0A8C6U1N7_9GOBI